MLQNFALFCLACRNFNYKLQSRMVFISLFHDILFLINFLSFKKNADRSKRHNIVAGSVEESDARRTSWSKSEFRHHPEEQ